MHYYITGDTHGDFSRIAELLGLREGWYAGHYHVESEEGDIRIMFEDYDEICEEAE